MEISEEHMSALMKPKGVIIVGATDRQGSVGKGILGNIICGDWPESSKRGRKSSLSNYGRSSEWPNLPYRVFPVNPKRAEILGFRCYPHPKHIEKDAGADLAVLCVPAKSCLEAIQSCGELGSVRAVIVIAAGFKEIGAEGEKLELECIEMAKKYNMGVTGPNCLGVQSPNFHLNASFAAANAVGGHIAFISQSGAICTAILDWSLGKSAAEASPIGFSAFVSLGSMAHVEWSDWISYCGADNESDAIVMYVETVGDAEKFLKAAQQVAQRKPIVVIKAGKTQEAAIAAASHTGSLTGTYGNFLAAMERAGCLVLDTIDDLQITIELLSSMSRRMRMLGNSSLAELGDDVIVVTNAGGPGVLCTDAVSEAGLKMVSPIGQEIISDLNEFLPAAWSHNNPIDILGDADEHCYRKAILAITKHISSVPTTVLIILTPQSVTKPTETAVVIREIVAQQKVGDPLILCSWMGGPAIEEGKQILQRANIPVFSQPDVAARALGLLRKQRRIASKIVPLGKVHVNTRAHELINQLRGGRSNSITLSEHDSKMVLAAYDLRITESVICKDGKDLKGNVNQIGGYPIVLKIHGGKFSHKSDIGGVILDINSEEEALKAFQTIKENYEKIDPQGFEGVTIQPMIGHSNNRLELTKHKFSPELIIGCVHDPQFGPMIMFGTGGTFVEIFNDTAITLCPIESREQARDLVGKTAISKALLRRTTGGGESSHSRFPSVNEENLYDTIIQFSRLCVDLKDDLLECEMNPLIITQDNNLLALDARIILRKK